MRRDAENLRQIILDSGFGLLEPLLMKYARPSIRIYTSPIENEDSFPLGQSKIGGSPDLPMGMNWAQGKDQNNSASLPFLAQFNLSDVKPYDAENLLPEQGWLYFFGEPVDHGQVIYFNGDAASLERKPFPDDLTPNTRDWGERYSPCKVEFVPEVNLPYYDANWGELREDQYPAGKTWQDFHAIVRAASYLEEPVETVNRLLGYNFDIPQDMQLDCELIATYGTPYDVPFERQKKHEATKGAWQHLLQLGSDDNAQMMWSDCGMVCFYVRNEDLKRKNFNSTCFTFFTP